MDELLANLQEPNNFTVETIESLTKYAITQAPCRLHQFETCVYPQQLALVWIDANSNGNLNYTSGPETEEYPSNMEEGGIIGYNWYLKRLEMSSEKVDVISKEEFIKWYTRVCKKIDWNISQHHGTPITTRSKNKLEPRILHFCDVLTIAMARKSDLVVPEVILKSNSLSIIEKNVIDYLFFNLVNDKKRCFTIKEREFVLDNANLYFFIYGLWHNYANKPVQLSTQGIPGMEDASIVEGDDGYRNHQKGKYNALQRKTHGKKARYMYIC